jgi:hypothetical protein
MRLASVIFLVFLIFPAGASAAADLTLSLGGTPGVQFGASHHMSGRLVDGSTPLAGRPVELRGRAYPYTGEFAPVATATTDANGFYAITKQFDRNMELQAVATDAGATSRVVRAYVFPRPHSVFRSLSGSRLRITQFLRTPENVRLSAYTNFYLGPANAKTAPRVARAKPRRVGRGRFRATATVKIPRSWNGRFRYASCFRYSEGSGLGNPRATCPKRYRFG